jgi:polyhydroxybutyrate depolymerase
VNGAFGFGRRMAAGGPAFSLGGVKCIDDKAPQSLLPRQRPKAPVWAKGGNVAARISPAISGLLAFAATIAAGWLLLGPRGHPQVAAAGPETGLAQACPAGSRTGKPDYHELQTSNQLTIAVRTPSDYNATRAYPLLIVFPPAGYDRNSSEKFYALTPGATRRGFVIAYPDHRRLSPAATSDQAKVAATVADFYCINEAAIAYLGHSDGGSMAEAIPAYIPDAPVPQAIVASGAGISGDDLATMACPSIASVMIIHSRNDERFPGFGRTAAAFWGRCAACKPAELSAPQDGCRELAGCASGRRVLYCETSQPHKSWPQMNEAVLDFIQGSAAKRQASQASP